MPTEPEAEAEMEPGAEPAVEPVTEGGPVPVTGEAAAVGWDGSLKQLAGWYDQFRTSRLHAQILMAAGLVALAWVSSLWPVGPLGRIRQELTMTVTRDYDFRGQAVLAGQWAKERGGWVPAVRGLWNVGVSRVQERLHLPALPGRPPATPPTGQQPNQQANQQASRQPNQQASQQPNQRANQQPNQQGNEQAPAQSADSNSTEPIHPAATRVMPVDGPVTYGYGWLPKGQQPHEGLDLAAKVGDPVVAMAEGTVLRVGTDELVGALIEVDHGFAVVTYGQVSGARVRAGDHVQQGQHVADIAKPSGKEGDTGPHLHLEVRPARGAKPIDPAPYLPLNGGSEI